MDLIPSINKTGRNSHQGYAFKSIEEVVAHFRPAFIKAGLTLQIDQIGREIIEKIMIFDFNLITTNVDDPSDFLSSTRSAVITQITETAPGKAEAYVVKNYLTKEYLIPAGKEDVEWADEGKAAVFNKNVTYKSKYTKQDKEPQVTPATKPGLDIDKFIDQLYDCESTKELKAVWRTLGQDIPSEVWDKVLPIYKKLMRSLDS